MAGSRLVVKRADGYQGKATSLPEARNCWCLACHWPVASAVPSFPEPSLTRTPHPCRLNHKSLCLANVLTLMVEWERETSAIAIMSLLATGKLCVAWKWLLGLNLIAHHTCHLFHGTAACTPFQLISTGSVWCSLWPSILSHVTVPSRTSFFALTCTPLPQLNLLSNTNCHAISLSYRRFLSEDANQHRLGSQTES
ncbi:hypothetical protein P154DRAFT_524647 [Amniculicola lignicola CBS 123094]|uniref:Uncharacterized protein n=1 Tax=Amniculicola lignicola CBS 123094 TaxID=1392246 RepID=A0A6A5WEL9_9PLEO|nr:hypothetical protein P154DRAFT_524647 [Amniculicola lignicola CBS 123094]